LKRHPRLIAALVAGAFYMEMLDGTVIATALPQMAQSFHTSPIVLSAGMSVYLLALAVFIPISGWVADRFGACTVFGSAIAGFTLASILCGRCNTTAEFVAARVLQGMAGAMMVPVGRLVVLNNTEKKDLMRAIAWITWPALLAPVIGPPLGGFITTYASWRWIFYLNVLPGILGVLLCLVLVPNDRPPEKPLDGMGFVLVGLCCTSFMLSMELISQQNPRWGPIVGLLAVSLANGVMAVRHTRRHPNPLLDLSALGIPTFAVAVWGGSLFRMAIYAIPFLLPLMFQVGFGLNAFASGLLVLGVFAGNVAMKPLTTPLLRRFGFRSVLLVNGVLTAVTTLACATLSPGMPRTVILIILFCGGLCRSMQFTSINTIAFADVPQPRLSAANTFFSTVQQMTIAMGITFGAVALRAALLLHRAKDAKLAVADFRVAFVFVAAAAAISVFNFAGLDRQAGAIVSGRSEY
jgi:EmrB/QacA subfamily drug resistance transporter